MSLDWPRPVPLARDGAGVGADFTLSEGEKATFVLRRLDPNSQSMRCPSDGESEDLFRDTVAYWRALALEIHFTPDVGGKRSTAPR